MYEKIKKKHRTYLLKHLNLAYFKKKSNIITGLRPFLACALHCYITISNIKLFVGENCSLASLQTYLYLIGVKTVKILMKNFTLI